jgi:hypothetical protein
MMRANKTAESVQARDSGNHLVGFGALVIVVRQTTSKEISGFYIVLARHYLEPWLFSVAF